MFDGEQRSVLNFTFTISDNALGFVEDDFTKKGDLVDIFRTFRLVD